MYDLQWAKEELQAAADEEYRKTYRILVPGLRGFLGVPIPQCRKIAKKLASGDWEKFLDEADDVNYEEQLLQGLVIGYAKMERKERAARLKGFLPLIDNWSVCDTCCGACKFMREDPKYWYDFIRPYALSSREYEARFAVVCMVSQFLEEPYRLSQFRIYGKICKKWEGSLPCYIQTAVAWAITRWYLKFPKETEAFLKRKTLDVATHNWAIRKIRRSAKVTPKERETLLELRR